jgi:E3 ubiquitin-protein ligase RNF38/44
MLRVQEGYKDRDLLGELKCGHYFHAGCIKKWLQVKNACPVCKSGAA